MRDLTNISLMHLIIITYCSLIHPSYIQAGLPYSVFVDLSFQGHWIDKGVLVLSDPNVTDGCTDGVCFQTVSIAPNGPPAPPTPPTPPGVVKSPPPPISIVTFSAPASEPTNYGAIAGGAGGAAFCIAAVIGGVLWYRRRRTKVKRGPLKAVSPVSTTPPAGDVKVNSSMLRL